MNYRTKTFIQGPRKTWVYLPKDEPTSAIYKSSLDFCYSTTRCALAFNVAVLITAVHAKLVSSSRYTESKHGGEASSLERIHARTPALEENTAAPEKRHARRNTFRRRNWANVVYALNKYAVFVRTAHVIKHLKTRNIFFVHILSTICMTYIKWPQSSLYTSSCFISETTEEISMEWFWIYLAILK